MYDRIKTQGFKYKRGYDLRNDLAGVTHGSGHGGHLRERCKKKQITLFSYLVVLIKIRHSVDTAEENHVYPVTPCIEG